MSCEESPWFRNSCMVGGHDSLQITKAVQYTVPNYCPIASINSTRYSTDLRPRAFWRQICNVQCKYNCTLVVVTVNQLMVFMWILLVQLRIARLNNKTRLKSNQLALKVNLMKSISFCHMLAGKALLNRDLMKSFYFSKQ
jgi:hypothetical protein